jgi:hypothetical protein
MPFTDDNIAIIRNRASSKETYHIIELMGVEFDALLARLEAAEAVCAHITGHQIECPTLLGVFDVWLKAAGKEDKQ